MSEMIERVADALESRFKSIVAEAAGKSFEETKVGLPDREVWRCYARCMIEAMREPTDAMLNAGPFEPYMDRDVWAKMIDAALEEE